MDSETINIVLGIVAATIAFFGAFLQTRKLMGLGSDHVVHLFLINRIKENRHRLFVQIPKLLNQSFCSAYPLFMHWMLSFFSLEKINIIAQMMNGVVNAIQTVSIYLIIVEFTNSPEHAGLISILFSLTPQFFHVFSARNYGLTARPLGVLMLSGCLISIVIGEQIENPLLKWIGGGGFAYLTWGVNVLATQGLILIASILAIAFHYPDLLMLAVVGAVLLATINRPYGWAYIKNTAKFINAYRTDLAPVFILRQRESIWKDFIGNFWFKKHYGNHELNYIYTNGAVIAHLLNPIGLICVFALFFRNSYETELVRLATIIGACGYITFILTSFRMTRFLGEPERYIEMVTMFSTIGGAMFVVEITGIAGLFLITSYYILCNCIQGLIIWKTGEKYKSTPERVQRVVTAINEGRPPTEIRFASNNEELTKLFMAEEWSFSRFNSAEQRYAGFKGIEAFEQFPLIRREAFENLLIEHKINICLLDKKHFEEIVLPADTGFKKTEIVYQDEKLLALAIHWDERKGKENKLR